MSTPGEDRDSGADRETTQQEIEQVVREVFEQRIPFNQVLGLEIESLSEPVSLGFDFRQQLVGNPVRQALHGGVTSAALDTVGGLAAFLDVMHRMEGVSLEERSARLGRIGTIDLRIDYLRSGRGERFVATGHVLRSGSRVVVTRMELHDQDGMLLAVGTGTYIVG